MHSGTTNSRGKVMTRRVAAPGPGLAYKLRNFPNIWRGLWRYWLARMLGIPTFYSQLYARVRRCTCGAPHAHQGELCPAGQWVNYGLVSTRVVTTAGVNAIVDAFQNTVEVENFKYHGLGTGTNAEASGDTALQTELTTEYNPNSTRATGTTTEGASANIYRTVATNTLDGAAAITEHGIFSQAATGGGTLFDRSVFSVINLASGDGLQTTYDWTASAGG